MPRIEYYPKLASVMVNKVLISGPAEKRTMDPANLFVCPGGYISIVTVKDQ